jgi:GT2 family glycosyltransferase
MAMYSSRPAPDVLHHPALEMNAPAKTTPPTTTQRDRPVVGVVTVLYNSDDVLEGFFRSLERQLGGPFDLRLYVLDNSPSDSGCTLTRRLAERHGIDTRVVFNDANLGVAKGNNQGIALARADGCSHVLLSNNDIEFEGGVIEGLLRVLDQGAASAVTPKIHYFDGDRQIWFVGGSFSPWTMQIHHHGIGQTDVGQFDQLSRIDYAPTCFMLLHADVFDAIGLMDEAYFVYYDDADYLWRMRRAGKVLQVVPRLLVRHKVSSSTGGDLSPFSVYYANRNRIYFLRKHLTGLQRVVALTYLLCTRAVQYLRLPHAAATKLREAVRDGFRLST